MAHARDPRRHDAEERANQRNAVLAGFLGWTLDAFDFFILTFVIDDVAKAFGKYAARHRVHDHAGAGDAAASARSSSASWPTGSAAGCR